MFPKGECAWAKPHVARALFLQQWLGQDFRLTNHKCLLTPGLDHFLEGLKDFSTLLSAEGRNFRLVYYKITRSHDK